MYTGLSQLVGGYIGGVFGLDRTRFPRIDATHPALSIGPMRRPRFPLIDATRPALSIILTAVLLR